MTALPSPPDALARAQLAHATRRVPLDTIAAMIGLTRSEFDRRRRRLGFPLRPVARAPARDAVPSPVRRVTLPAGPIDRVAVGRAMERFIAGRVAAYEADAAAGHDAEPERTARTIAHYARALGLVRTYLDDLKTEVRADDEPPPRSLSELRDELRRHLDRIWDEEEDARRLEAGGADQG